MKRSDMVARLAISLMTRLPEWEKQERLKFADEILNDLEIEGMIPPPEQCQKLIKKYVDPNFNVWEPEE